MCTIKKTEVSRVTDSVDSINENIATAMIIPSLFEIKEVIAELNNNRLLTAIHSNNTFIIVGSKLMDMHCPEKKVLTLVLTH